MKYTSQCECSLLGLQCTTQDSYTECPRSPFTGNEVFNFVIRRSVLGAGQVGQLLEQFLLPLLITFCRQLLLHKVVFPWDVTGDFWNVRACVCMWFQVLTAVQFCWCVLKVWSSCFLLHIIERKTETTGTQGRSKRLLDDLQETRRYWKLTKEKLDRAVWRTRIGRSYGHGVRQTMGWVNKQTNELMNKWTNRRDPAATSPIGVLCRESNHSVVGFRTKKSRTPDTKEALAMKHVRIRSARHKVFLTSTNVKEPFYRVNITAANPVCKTQCLN